ncbi:hypothetical protein FIV42_05195 [Persicimonas caeni]|uniref:Uncharacterized protein n=1 Tax=Persicimonas caeni TaxID=2292766 RepID=A0A4Y6PPF5_PERCE|nr:hypothetical protein [Persicimonas caeni]QDG50150.1 hypothetical protein FIV42_05195 [Persicimonas caeni]QED31371.1 hypothetical protein FRD00_05190 [Persicimonas caeni]
MEPMTHLADIRQRLWLAATLVAIVFTVLVGGVGALGSEAFAASQKKSCCCDASGGDMVQKGQSHHQKAQSESDCHDVCQDHGCTCHIAPDNNTPAGNVLALSNSTISFAPALAAQDHLQLRLPQPRAPGVVSSPLAPIPPHSPPLFLLHQTFLI